MIANMMIANNTNKPIWSSGAMALMMDFSTTCKPTGRKNNGGLPPDIPDGTLCFKKKKMSNIRLGDNTGAYAYYRQTHWHWLLIGGGRTALDILFFLFYYPFLRHPRFRGEGRPRYGAPVNPAKPFPIGRVCVRCLYTHLEFRRPVWAASIPGSLAASSDPCLPLTVFVLYICGNNTSNHYSVRYLPQNKHAIRSIHLVLCVYV